MLPWLIWKTFQNFDCVFKVFTKFLENAYYEKQTWISKKIHRKINLVLVPFLQKCSEISSYSAASGMILYAGNQTKPFFCSKFSMGCILQNKAQILPWLEDCPHLPPPTYLTLFLYNLMIRHKPLANILILEKKTPGLWLLQLGCPLPGIFFYLLSSASSFPSCLCKKNNTWSKWVLCLCRKTTSF